jgi:hypothetical protein
MGYRARVRIEHYDPEAEELHASSPGDACDYLPEKKVALYLERGLIERVGGEPEQEPAPVEAPADDAQPVPTKQASVKKAAAKRHGRRRKGKR